MSDNKTKPAAKKSAAVQKTAAEVGFCVYIGPTLAGVIQNGTIIRGNRKKVLSAMAPVIEKHPLVATLIVSGDTLPVDRIKVNTPGNLLYVNYRKLLSGNK